jgi:hypothetical protein
VAAAASTAWRNLRRERTPSPAAIAAPITATVIGRSYPSRYAGVSPVSARATVDTTIRPAAVPAAQRNRPASAAE